ncbi:hypothetical protein I552_5261 [Mycobacterium xenopi 3993]|nr:hypothetical protein I552_5261 [Mycobacterium xenopi 3993]
MAIDVTVLRVFTDPQGNFGNPWLLSMPAPWNRGVDKAWHAN